jgi:hypothetical protein
MPDHADAHALQFAGQRRSVIRNRLIGAGWIGRIVAGEKQVPYVNQIVWAAVATSTGLPATVAPIGHSESGLPIGVQIIGGYLQDHTTIAFAGLIEHAFGGSRRRNCEIHRGHDSGKAIGSCPETRVQS